MSDGDRRCHWCGLFDVDKDHYKECLEHPNKVKRTRVDGLVIANPGIVRPTFDSQKDLEDWAERFWNIDPEADRLAEAWIQQSTPASSSPIRVEKEKCEERRDVGECRKLHCVLEKNHQDSCEWGISEEMLARHLGLRDLLKEYYVWEYVDHDEDCPYESHPDDDCTCDFFHRLDQLL